MKIIDTANDVSHRLDTIKTSEIECVIRYISTYTANEKCIKEHEARAIANAGLKLGLVFEVWGGSGEFSHDDINGSTGRAHGAFARDYAPKVGAPDGTIIYFAIDTDVDSEQWAELVRPYLRAAKTAMGGKFRMGVYGCGLVCQLALDQGLVDATWLSQSMGWNRSRAFRESGRWRLLQGPESTFHGLSIDTNEANGADYGAFVPFSPAQEPQGSPPVASGEDPGATTPPLPPSDPASLLRVLMTKAAELASSHPAARVNWPGRGVAPIGYSKGMAAAYVLACHRLADGDKAMAAAAADKFGGHDALANYGIRLADTPAEILRQTYTLLWGLGMRESAGKFCEGRDMSATNVTADTAEAGLFQVSWDIRAASPLFMPLFLARAKQADDVEGLGPIFHEGIHCYEDSLRCWGEGVGYTFQRMTKASPMFAIEIALVGLRCVRSHWGPIIRHEAQMRTEVSDLLEKIEAMQEPEA